ncbi:MAG: glutathione S-transferase family protein [Acidobacteriota bacterium]
MIWLYRFPRSTNVERVALALAHKGLETRSIEIDPEDRTEVRRVSGQDLVPVIVDAGHGDRVVCDSMEIVRYLEERFPEKPLYPRDPARRTEMLIFIDWFNRVWKRPPNFIYTERRKAEPDRVLIDASARETAAALDLFEQMLSGRDYLMGDELSAADCAAFPFLKFAALRDGDLHPFHRILVETQPLGTAHARLAAWIRRVDEHPRA